MLRQLIEAQTGKLTDSQYREIMKQTIRDIKANKIGFKKRTSLKYVLFVAVKTHSILQKVAEEESEQKEKGPQVLAHLTDRMKITSTESIPQTLGNIPGVIAL